MVSSRPSQIRRSCSSIRRILSEANDDLCWVPTLGQATVVLDPASLRSHIATIRLKNVLVMIIS
eukprot:scaffold228284_cov15-Prasinocladus_malaysianus.AAC.1